MKNCKYIIHYQHYVQNFKRENRLVFKSIALKNVVLRDRCIVLFSSKVSPADARLEGKWFEKDSRSHTDMF